MELSVYEKLKSSLLKYHLFKSQDGTIIFTKNYTNIYIPFIHLVFDLTIRKGNQDIRVQCFPSLCLVNTPCLYKFDKSMQNIIIRIQLQRDFKKSIFSYYLYGEQPLFHNLLTLLKRQKFSCKPKDQKLQNSIKIMSKYLTQVGRCSRIL